MVLLSSNMSSKKQVVAAIVLIWLWVQHKEIFQRAFAKSGRIDVDPECKWLIQAAVDTATRALAAEFVPKTNSVGDGKSKGMHGLESVANTELQVASTVSKALCIPVHYFTGCCTPCFRRSCRTAR